MTNPPIRIATRASQLALWQARHIAESLRRSDAQLEVELVEISTQGDRDRVEPLRQFGGLGVFTREVQKAVLDRRADLAVHSLKDLPTAIVEGLSLCAVPSRASVYDVLVLPKGTSAQSLDELPEGAIVGTGSPRRQAQLLSARPDLRPAEIRGNVETRLKKLDDGEYDAIVLAEAGLARLGYDERITLRLSPPEMLPAVAQGALGLECRQDDDRVKQATSSLIDRETQAATIAERTLLAELRAGCHAPLGAFCECDGDELKLSGVVLSLDGSERVDASAVGSIETPADLGRELAQLLIDQGAQKLLETQQ